MTEVHDGTTVWTIGHSTRTLDELLDTLTVNRVEAVADVRRFPASRKYPHFNRDVLTASLSQAGIEYVWLPELGGRRPPRPDSHNTLWRNASFRGYADFMETEEFHTGMQRLLRLAEVKRTAIMCAEAVWWRCHRSLIADSLKVRGATVWHLTEGDKREQHPYTSAARVQDGKLSYGPEG